MTVRQYQSYKASGVNWLGEVPSHWSVAPLKQVAGVVNGYPFDSKLFNGAKGYPLVRIRDLGSSETETYYDGDFIEAAAITSDDVLIGMDGDFNVGRWLGSGTALLNQRVCCVRGASALTNKLLEYALTVPLKAINDVTYSTTVKHLSSYQVEKIRFALPPETSERIAIATFLDRETSKIDALVEEQKRLIELLKEKRQAVISHAVTKGLNPNVPMKASGVEWLGEVPEHWVVKPLKLAASVQTGTAKGKDNSGKDTVIVPYLRVANVQDGYLDLTDVAEIEIPASDLDRYRLRRGDVLMNEGGDFDKLGRGHVWYGEIDPCIHQNHVFAVRPREVSPEWLNAVTSSAYAQFYFMSRSKQSTNLASISSTNIMELPLVLPPRDEQVEILQNVDRQLSRLSRLSAECNAAIQTLQERRSALISAAVTGKIDVRQLADVETAA